jgi:hypothetical protein
MTISMPFHFARIETAFVMAGSSGAGSSGPDDREGLKQQNPPREEVRWVSLVLEGLLGGEETIRFDRVGRR